MPGDTIFRAGAGSAVICHPAEFFPQERFTKVHDDIHARAIILDETDRMVLISLELPSLRPYSLIDEMKVLVSKITGTDDQNIWICVTHNLSAPHVPNRNEYPEKHNMHIDAVRNAIKCACEKALQTLQPARVGSGTGESLVNTNRDIETAQGWWLGIHGTGPVDHMLTVIRLESLDGSPIGILYHYAVKSSIMEEVLPTDGGRHSTGDLTGEASRFIEQRLGVPAVFFMGAAGDQVPEKKAGHYMADEKGQLAYVSHGEQGFAYISELGGILGQNVVDNANTVICTQEESVFQLGRCSFFLPGQQPYSGERPYKPDKDYTFVPASDQELTVEILALGKVVFLGVKPEATAIVGMELRERCKPNHVLMVSMVNGGKDYLADISAYERCTFAATHSDFAYRAAEKFLELAENFGMCL